ncbi:SMI1/KNR4 family protein [Streptomyces sp. NRRL S-340]|uniref:SMI1/KNR4 family protein n=1 Tax=Streptomyces sp. NRRL S-340 TaxID=1463901 RepID=UPI00055C2014|nr:SMI1/KNR4 family protein [Streptomyces sp. NRRL S-340]
MPGERLDAEWVRSWREQADTALTKLTQSFLSTHGFPPGHNAVTPATDDSHQATDALVDRAPIPSDLTTLYRVISGASLPDVDNGYFIHSPAKVAEHFREYGPAPMDDESVALVFASDGGGHLFAIGDSGQVRKSTTASWCDDFEVVASSLREFLEQLGGRIANHP